MGSLAQLLARAAMRQHLYYAVDDVQLPPLFDDFVGHRLGLGAIGLDLSADLFEWLCSCESSASTMIIVCSILSSWYLELALLDQM